MIENPSSLAEHVSNLTECIAEDIKKLQTDTSRAVYTVNNVAAVDGNVVVDIPTSVHVGQTTPEDEDVVVWVDPDSSGIAVVKTVNNVHPDNRGNVVVDYVASTTKAVQDSEGNEITQTYVKKEFIGDQLIDYVALYDSIMNSIISAGGRKLYRHDSGMGTVIEFNDGQDRKVLVLDAQYRVRELQMSSDYNTDLPLPNYYPNNNPSGEMSKEELEANGLKEAWFGFIQEGDWRNSGLSYNEWGTDESRATTPEACESLTDADLNRLWWTDENTSKFNTDAWLTKADCECATHCRSIKVNGTGCDIPNFQTLLRIYCEGVNIDALDPTLADNPQLGLSNWFDSWSLWSSSEFYSSGAWIVVRDGCSDLAGVSDGFGVCPVLEL